MRSITRRLLTAAVGAISVAALTAALPATAAAEPDPSVCQSVTFPVSIVSGLPKSYTIAGQLCRPADSGDKPLQVLVPGFTYDRSYWDLPGADPKYSYQKAMTVAGYPTLAIDPLGSGQSSYPPSALLTHSAEYTALHDVVQAVRAGNLPGGAFGKVVLVGHSYGSITSMGEAATFHDVDGMVATGISHTLAPIGMSEAALSLALNPAMLDPKFASKVGLDPAYVTTSPNTRGSLFYNTANTDPAVLAADEASKSTGSLVELATMLGYIEMTEAITAPTLVVNGTVDRITCRDGGGLALESCATNQALYNWERPFWLSTSDLQTYVLADAGHSINFAPNVDQYRNRVIQWLQEKFPRS